MGFVAGDREKKAHREEDGGQGGLEFRSYAGEIDATAKSTAAPEIKGKLIHATRRGDALGEFLPRFLLGRRQRILARTTPVLLHGRNLRGEPVLREFGGEGVHDRCVVGC